MALCVVHIKNLNSVVDAYWSELQGGKKEGVLLGLKVATVL